MTLEYSFAGQFGEISCGIYRFKENEILEEIYYQSKSKEAYELEFEVSGNGEMPSSYRFNEEKNT